MIDQDPCSGSIAGDLGRGTMTATRETESMEDVKELTGAVGRVNESASVEYLSDVKWRDGDPLFVFDDDNVMKPQTLTAAWIPIQACEEEDAVAPSFKSLLEKKPRFWETITDQLLKTASGCLKPNYDEKELVGFTQPSLVGVIPWIRYEAQNMVELSFRQELQCIRETEHLQYIIVMIVWFRYWKQDHGWWSSIPACSFQVRAITTINIETRVLSVLAQVDMS